MSEEFTIFLHASYVAFVFACLLFGALAYRQVLENLTVRRLKAGEDRRAFLSATSVLVLVALLAVNALLAWLCFRVEEPTVYAYALPLVMLVQNAQLAMRTVFQRTVAKTKALIVRSVLLERVRVASYADIIAVEFHYSWLWVQVTLDVLPDERVTFRIFRGSAPALSRILLASCICPITSVGRAPHYARTTSNDKS